MVFPRGLTLNCNGEALEFTKPLLTKEEMSAAEHAEANGSEMTTVSGSAILCIRPGITNYGHFLIEMLPNILAAEEAFPEENFTILFANVKGKLKEVYDQSFRALGCKSKKVHIVSEYPIRVENLYIVIGQAITDEYTSPNIRLTTERISSYVKENLPKSGPISKTNTRLFLPRKSGNNRLIENIGEVESVLVEEFEFSKYFPEDDNFYSQVEKFQAARYLVGTMGSALTNMIFSPSNSGVLSFAPMSMVDTFFWRLSCLSSHRYYEIRCREIENVTATRTWNRSIEVNLEDLRASMDEMIKGETGTSG